MKALCRLGTDAGAMAVQDMPKPEVKRDWVLLKVAAGGICGSDVGDWQAEQKQEKEGDRYGARPPCLET